MKTLPEQECLRTLPTRSMMHSLDWRKESSRRKIPGWHGTGQNIPSMHEILTRIWILLWEIQSTGISSRLSIRQGILRLLDSTTRSVMETKMYYNEFGFSQENIDTVKDSLVLSSGTDRILSGKTGTGMVNGQNVNGWFVGYVEVSENVYFFAANIQNEDNASGSAASDIALSVLGSFGIWQ